MSAWLTDEVVELALNEWLLQNNIYTLKPGDPSYEESRGQMKAVLLKVVGERNVPSYDANTANFVKWLKAGPKLAKACGLYVGIKVEAAKAEGLPLQSRKE